MKRHLQKLRRHLVPHKGPDPTAVREHLAWIVTFCNEHEEWFGGSDPTKGAEHEWLHEANVLLGNRPPTPAMGWMGAAADPAQQTRPRAAGTCEGCQDKGWLLFSDNQVQRCDDCQRFPGDLEAAAAFFRDPETKTLGYTLNTITVNPRRVPSVVEALRACEATLNRQFEGRTCEARMQALAALEAHDQTAAAPAPLQTPAPSHTSRNFPLLIAENAAAISDTVHSNENRFQTCYAQIGETIGGFTGIWNLIAQCAVEMENQHPDEWHDGWIETCEIIGHAILNLEDPLTLASALVAAAFAKARPLWGETATPSHVTAANRP